MKRLRWGLVLVWLWPTLVLANSWRIEPATAINMATLAELRRLYPDIDSPYMLQQLLQAINNGNNFSTLEAVLSGDEIVVKAVVARPLGRINTKLTTREFQSGLNAFLQRYLGQVNSSDLQQKIAEDAKTYLKDRGFFKVTVAVTVDEKDAYDVLNLQIREGEPCLLRAIRIDYNLPDQVNSKIKRGDLCDMDRAQSLFGEIEEIYRNEGYARRKLEKPQLEYDAEHNVGIFVFKGTLGPKISYRVMSDNKDPISDDFEKVAIGLGDAEAVKTELIRQYQKAGYDEVSVEGPAEIQRSDRVRFEYRVDPGIAYTIESVQIEGNTALNYDECLETLGLDSWIARPALNRESIRVGIESLKARYQQMGYWDVQIDFPRINKDPNRRVAHVFFLINERKHRVFDGLSIQGNSALTEGAIRDMLELKVRESINWDEVNSFEQKLRTTYQRRGYIHAKIKLSIKEFQDPQEVRVQIMVNIEENHKVRFGPISIVGLAGTDPKVVRRELRFSEGEDFNPEKVEDTRRALISLGLFSSVSISPADTAVTADGIEVESAPYTIAVTEAKPGNIFFGPGWSLVEGARFGIQASYNNLQGLNRQIFAKATASEQQQQDAIGDRTLIGRTASIGYVEPYFNDWPINATATVSTKAEAAPKRWDLSRAFDLTFSHVFREWMPTTKVSTSYGQKINEEIAEDFQENYFLAAGNVRTGRVSLRLQQDRRNDLAWPTQGYFAATEFGLARFPLGGDLAYNYWQVSASAYFELTANWVFVTGFQLAAFENVVRRGQFSNVLPPSERLYAGGADTNRGYAQRSLGPVIRYYNETTHGVDEEVSGGSRRSIFKSELRYQLKKQTLALIMFLDASTTFLSKREEEAILNHFANTEVPEGSIRPELLDNYEFSFEEIIEQPSIIWNKQYTSYGLALSYLTPLGSLNFSYGLPLKRCPTVDGKCQKERGGNAKDGALAGVFYLDVGADF